LVVRDIKWGGYFFNNKYVKILLIWHDYQIDF